MRVAVILLAAGTGRRFASGLERLVSKDGVSEFYGAAGNAADLPKQYWLFDGKPVIRHAAEALLPFADMIQPVGDAAALSQVLDGLSILPPVPGGAERQDSVRAGLEALEALEAPPEYVLVHDGARPYVPRYVTQGVLDALQRFKAAIPAVKLADTLKRVKGDVIEGTIDRANLHRAQTPQGFHFPALLAHHRQHERSETDDAALFEAAGEAVAIVPGDEDNIKLTQAEDLVRLERLLGTPPCPRTGLGYDVHAFADDRDLIICGVKIPHERGLAGHSDADVGIHTLCDAIYGALSEGDIGYHFPPSKDEWKDMDSARFLIHAGQRIRERGGRLINADITIICERPKIGPHVTAMRARLACLLEVDVERISVKATTSERLGFTGREEGIAATAVATVLLP